MNAKVFAASALATAIFTVPAFAPAQAAPKCQGQFQYNKAAGGMISTPYCRDNYLASIARAAGMRVTNAQVRTNPNRKREACRLVGYDPRVQNICAGVVYEGRGRF